MSVQSACRASRASPRGSPAASRPRSFASLRVPRRSWQRCLGRLLSGRCHGTVPIRAPPAANCRHQPHRPLERPKTCRLHAPGAIRPHLPTAGPPHRPRLTKPHQDPQRPARLVANRHNFHIGAEPDQQLIDTRRVALHGDPPGLARLNSADSGGSPRSDRDPHTTKSTLKREAPHFFKLAMRDDAAEGFAQQL